MASEILIAEVMAQPPEDRLEYALGLLAFYLDPQPEFFSALQDLGLRLPLAEARILHALELRRGAFVSPRALLAAAMADRPADEWPDLAVLYARLSSLRTHLAAAGLPVSITTWSGVGYRLDSAEDFAFSRVAS